MAIAHGLGSMPGKQVLKLDAAAPSNGKDRRTSLDRRAAAAGTVALHVLLAWWIGNLEERAPGGHAESQPLTLYWIEPPPELERTDAAPKQTAALARPPPAPPRPFIRIEVSGAQASAPEVSRGALQAVDLRPRETLSFESPEAGSLPWDRELEREAPTRFDGAWAPTTKSIQHELAFRSRIAGYALGAVGALREPCTRAERDRMEEKCHGAQYRGDFDTRVEEAQRAIAPL